jgi:hypothetical protein
MTRKQRRAERRRLIQHFTDSGFDIAEARQAAAISMGESQGDCIAVDEHGREVRQPEPPSILDKTEGQG